MGVKPSHNTAQFSFSTLTLNSPACSSECLNKMWSVSIQAAARKPLLPRSGQHDRRHLGFQFKQQIESHCYQHQHQPNPSYPLKVSIQAAARKPLLLLNRHRVEVGRQSFNSSSSSKATATSSTMRRAQFRSCFNSSSSSKATATAERQTHGPHV